MTQFIESCGDGPLNFNKLSHECRVDKNSKDLQVLTTQYKAMVVPNVSVPLKMGPTQTLVEHVDTFATTEVVAWDHEANAVSTLYDLNDVFSPTSAGAFFETTAWNSVHMTCAGASARNAIEFHHVSSISVGRDDNILVSSRNLDTIWSLKRDGSGLQWTLSSHDEVGSDFAFERDLDKFYQPHAVIQLDNGNIVMMDDGTDRPGCTIMRTGQCFSRAIMYRLDREAMVARVVYAFGRMSMAGRVCPLTSKTAPASPSICQSSSLKSSWMSRTSARSRYWNMTTASSMAATSGGTSRSESSITITPAAPPPTWIVVDPWWCGWYQCVPPMWKSGMSYSKS